MLKPYTIPKLCKSKDGWYVYYRFRDERTGIRHLFRVKGNLNREKNLRDRDRMARHMIADLTSILKEGTNPIIGLDDGTGQVVQYQQTELPRLLIQMLDTKKGSIRHRSYQSYKYAIDALVKFLNEKRLQFIMPEKFTTEIALQFADWAVIKMKYKGKSFNGLIGFLRIMFNMLIDRGVITVNPFRKVRKMQEETGRNIAFSDRQKEQLKNHLQKHDPRMWLFVKFIYHCYIRPLELLRVRVRDIDLANRTIIIHSQIGKNKRQMAITIPDTFIDEVQAMKLKNINPDYFLFGNKYKPYGKMDAKGGRSPGSVCDLLPGETGASRNTISQRFSKVLKELKFPKDHTLYSWKHTGVCDAHRAGVNIYDIMRQLRHHSLEQTLTYMKSMGLQPNTGFQTKAPSL